MPNPKREGKFHHKTCHDGIQGEQSYTVSTNSALDAGRWPLYWERDPVPFSRRLDGHRGLSGGVRKISSPPGFDPQAVKYIYGISFVHIKSTKLVYTEILIREKLL
jgi:hypothetical protein